MSEEFYGALFRLDKVQNLLRKPLKSLHKKEKGGGSGYSGKRPKIPLAQKLRQIDYPLPPHRLPASPHFLASASASRSKWNPSNKIKSPIHIRANDKDSHFSTFILRNPESTQEISISNLQTKGNQIRRHSITLPGQESSSSSLQSRGSKFQFPVLQSMQEKPGS